MIVKSDGVDKGRHFYPLFVYGVKCEDTKKSII